MTEASELCSEMLIIAKLGFRPGNVPKKQANPEYKELLM